MLKNFFTTLRNADCRWAVLPKLEAKNCQWMLACLLVGTISCELAQAEDKVDVRSYIFGNSLINHLTDSSETTVPYWLHHLAHKAGHSYAMDGQWGFLRNFAEELPPKPNWSFDGVRNVWVPERQSFRAAAFNSVLINPANFLQYQPPTVPYEGSNSTDQTPVGATLAVFDWVAMQTPDTAFFVYEGWAEMAGFGNSFPPNAKALENYHAYNGSEYHTWYQAYLAALQTARPEMDIRLISVAKVLSGLLTETQLSKIPVTELYSDDAPHGTATLYFLASLITYQALFDEDAPLNFEIPTTVHSLVRENYSLVVGYIASADNLKKAAREQVTNIQFTAAAAPDNPPLAMGLNGIADWSVQQPFVDIMKTSRSWVGHLPGQWGGWDYNDLKKGGYLDENGWPTSIPDELTHIETFVLTDQPEESALLAGRYRLSYKGEGTIRLGGRARRPRYRDGEIWFSYTPGEDLVGISIKATDPRGTGNYIRDISIVREDQIELFEVGVVFNPHWTRLIKDLRSVRFMDWMFTNGSEVTSWDQRPRNSDYSYSRVGVPVELMVQLANELGIDPWFNMPHLADNEFSREFATYVQQHLDPR